MNRGLALAGVVAGLGLGGGQAAAQGRGNFDPEQARQRMMDNYKDRLEVTSDAEWKITEERITKVVTAQRETRVGGRGFGGPGGRRGGGGPDGAPPESGTRTNRGGMFGPAQNAEADALQKALEAKASSEELKGKLGKLRESLKEKEAALAKAQDELRKVLSVRREATAVMMGLLK